ncbi:methyltransferase domain-containing protein [Rhabdothermincola salaria]|uniref:methyltransferase domain-containing protein n=1 Tax=Rhabdothermincola salaria TaxID=2903142 RepID=UPI001E4BC96F|nr:methyltransferase domain-containing protein [Rhabdothermincola salaria]MCD9623704.1 methyltransferase domain-containing protein [Rhabdothermincola salaria]
MQDTTTTTNTLTVDPEALRAEVRTKYTDVATDPGAGYHFHTGRPLAERLGYPTDLLAELPDDAVASFAGVGNPFSAAPLPEGANVVDLGSGGGFDCVVAAHVVGRQGHVIGVDMTEAMLERARRVASTLGLDTIDYRAGILEDLPVPDGWADVVISNGVLNLVADKARVFGEARRVLRPGGVLQFADIAVGRDVPDEARSDIGLWTDCIAGGRSVDEWCAAIEEAGFTGLSVGMAVDTFGGAPGEERARSFDVYSHTFRARRR